MANTDKNIIITPNKGSTNNPKVDFVAASATLGPQTVTATAIPTSNGTISFSGTAGQLFSISNSMTGSIYAVSDVSGIPSIEVFDTGLVRLAQYSGNVVIGNGTDNGTDKVQINGSAQASSLGIGTPASGTAGEIRATNNITAYYSSDARLKENVVPISDALEKLNKIRGVEFDWTDGYIASHGGEDGYFIRRHDIGVIAQEVQQVLPEVVSQREDGMLAVKYDRIVSLLIEAIKELQAEVAVLKSSK